MSTHTICFGLEIVLLDLQCNKNFEDLLTNFRFNMCFESSKEPSQ